MVLHFSLLCCLQQLHYCCEEHPQAAAGYQMGCTAAPALPLNSPLLLLLGVPPLCCEKLQRCWEWHQV
jgi:hypothetical protein